MTITLSAGRYTISLQKAVEQTTTLKTYQKGLGVFAISTSLTSSTYGGFSVFNRYAVDGVKPILVYNFENGIYGALPSSRRQELDDLVTITRASTGTYLDASGVIQTSAADVARFDYSTGARALLLEASATNLLQRSQDLSLWPWGNDGNRLTITEDSGVAPDGSATATLLVSNAASGLHRVMQMHVPTLGTRYTFSVYLKAAGTRYVFVNCDSMLNARLTVDLTTGAYVSTGPGPFTVTALPNGWWRVALTGVAAATNDGVYLQANTSLFDWDQAFAGDGTSGFYAWGAQLEVRATATSYIPTTGTAVTRAADIVAPIDLTGYDLSGGYTVVAWGQLDGVVGTFDRVLQLDTGSDANRHFVYWTSGGSRLGMEAFADSASQATVNYAGGPQLGQPFKVAMAVGPAHFRAARNGVVSALDTSVTYVTPSVLRLARAISGSKPARLLLSRVALYPKLLNADDLMEVTL